MDIIRVVTFMKYGYLFYQKKFPKLKKERPINLGDPIQSLAIMNLYKEMGIKDEDMVPVDRYELANYKGENLRMVVNGIEGYEHYAYHTHALPPSSDLNPVYFSYCLMREIDEEMKENFCKYGPVGCRDIATMERMKASGIDAYVSGCITITFPKREETEEQTEVFFIDCPSGLKSYIPKEIAENATFLSSVVRYKSENDDDNMSIEETMEFHKMAEERLNLLRDKAKLVVSSRFHAALPALAMGIPTIITINTADSRFEILKNLVPIYTQDKYDKINWNPDIVDLESIKEKVKSAFYAALNKTGRPQDFLVGVYPQERNAEKYEFGALKALNKIEDVFVKGNFRFAVWGVCLVKTLQICDRIHSCNNTNELVAAIDTFQTGTYMGKNIILPSQISELPEDVVVLVLAPSVIENAKEQLNSLNRRYIVINGEDAILYNFDL